jgi:two-component system sporulation sensor kinase A
MARVTCATPVSERAARAHAQKNCLSVILAVASVIARDVDERHGPRMRRLESAAKRIAALIEADLQDSAETVRGHREEVDVQTLFQNVCETLRDRAEAASVTLLVDCAGDRDSIQGDEGALGEALFNLIANAIEATPTGSAVTIHAGRTPLGDHTWCIQDSGDGVAEDMLDALGIPFRTSRIGGSGLGLAVASSIVRDHGGALWLDTIAGRGTTVTIWIPAAEQGVQA